MLSAIRRRVTFANVAMTLALVLAMSGGAYAAGKFVITSTKQISPKVVKSLKGANGENGANGATGPAGPVGPAGPKGENGSPGGVGANGESVTSVELKKGSTTCKEGGAEFKVAGVPTHACNGATGSPWVASGTLPPGKREAGVWGISRLAETVGFFELSIPISFSIPLAAPIAEANVHIFEGTTLPSGCTGAITTEGSIEDLAAEAGNLCIFVALQKGMSAASLLGQNLESGGAGAGRTGTVLTNGSGAANADTWAKGLWAVAGNE